MTEDEFNDLDTIIKDGVNDNPEIKVLVPTVYHIINKGKLKAKRIDLPYDVKQKKKSLKSFELYPAFLISSG